MSLRNLVTRLTVNRFCRQSVFSACVILLAMCQFCSQAVAAEPFINAIRSGDLAKVKQLVGVEPDLIGRDLEGGSPLFWAVVDHHVDIAEWLLENGADANQRGGQDNRTPIFNARTAEMAKLLLKHGAEPKMKSDWSSTPLMEAIKRRHVGVVNVLLNAGVGLDFDAAVQLGRTKLVREMLAEKPWLAKPPAKPLYHAALDGNLDLVKLLLQHGADPNLDYGFMNVWGPYTPVSNAVIKNHYETAKVLFEHGGNPNASGGRNHENLFLFAIAYLDVKFTKLMLEHGADLIAGDSWGKGITPLHVAAALGRGDGAIKAHRVGQPPALAKSNSQALEKVSLLVRAGANVAARAKDLSTPLLQAALAGNEDICQLLMDNGAKLDIGSACLLGKRATVANLLEQSPDLAFNSDLPLGQSALHYAVRADDIETVRMLVGIGANVDTRAPELEYQDAGGFSAGSYGDALGLTALNLAVQLGHERVVATLLDLGADPNLKVDDDLIDIAMADNHWGIVRLLLDHDAEVSLSYGVQDGLSAMTDVSLLRRVIEAVDDDFSESPGTDALRVAFIKKNKVTSDLLIAHGAQIDFHLACEFGFIDKAKRMLEKDPELAKIVPANYSDVSPIELAVRNGSQAIVQLLIDYGAPLSSDNHRGKSLGHLAASEGQLEVLRVLLSHGLPIDVKNDGGSTLLHAAASGVQPEVARFLISQGLEVNCRDFRGSTPLHNVAGWSLLWNEDEREEKYQRTLETARVLLDAGAEVNAKDKYDDRPLHKAARDELEDVVRLFLNRGADVNARDYRNQTPLAVAGRTPFSRSFQSQPKSIEKLLREHGGIE